MIGSTNRATRRSKVARRAKAAAVTATAAAMMVMGLGTPPAANAAIAVPIDVDPVYTAGFLAGVLNFVGDAFPGTSLGGVYNSGPPQTVSLSLPTIEYPYETTVSGIPVKLLLQLNVFAELFLNNIRPTDTQYLYNTLAAIPQRNTGCGGSVLGTDSNPATSCRFSFTLGTSEATLNLANAYRTQIASVVEGSTPAGYIPFQPTVGSTAAKPTQTNQVLAFLQNPLRPNGGFLSRFPGLSELLGQDPTMPAAGRYTSPDGTMNVNTTTIDATWAYDPTGDFPEVFNIFSILNSVNAFLPLNLVGGLDSAQPFVFADSEGKAAAVQDFGLSLAALLQVPVSPVPVVNTYYLPMEPGKGYYATIVPSQLPIFNVLRLPSLIINAALGALGARFQLGTPLSDALEPATKILVNIGYDDVVTPEMIADDPTTYGGYQAYDRTFLTSGVTTPFGSVQPLTKAEQRAVPGDVWNALVDGLKAQFAKPFWGIIEPVNSAQSPASASVQAVEAPRPQPAAAATAAAPPKDSAALQRVSLDPMPSAQEVATQVALPSAEAAGDSAPASAITPLPVVKVAAAAEERASARGSRGTVANRAGVTSQPSTVGSADSDQPSAKTAASAPRQRASR
jgi:hypothetical protein